MKYILLVLMVYGCSISSSYDQILSWNQVPIEIEEDLPCSFDVVIRFNQKYYAFASIQGTGSGVGYPFWAIKSKDGIHWKKIKNASFGNQNDIAIDSALVYKNSEGEKHLYIAARNKVSGVNVYRTNNGKNWEQVIQDGLDSPYNDRINVMVGFNGKLYLITENDIDQGGRGSRFLVSETGNPNDWQVIKMSDEMRSAGALAGAKMKHLNFNKVEQSYFYFVAGNTNIWRSIDGENWSKMPFNIWINGYGVELIDFDNYVYMATFDEFEYITRLFRSMNPATGNWEELDLGVDHEQLITVFSRKSRKNANKLWFATYPSGYMFRIGKDTHYVERVSEEKLGYSSGPKFPTSLIFMPDGLSVYSGSKEFWQKK